MSMKKVNAKNLEDFALYKVLLAHNCVPTIPAPNASAIDEQKMFKEAVQAVEGWAHDYNNTHENILEFFILKKIEFFACDAQKIRKFFSEFLTALIHGPDDADWRMLCNVFGVTCSKRCIKYIWTARFNLLTFIDKKVFLYQPFKKIWLTLDQCNNISPKFFTKDAAKTMENFGPSLTALSTKIRNKDMVCVSDWYELLFSQYCSDNPYSVKQYTRTGVPNANASFMIRCFGDLNFEGTAKGKAVDAIIEEKRQNDLRYPTDSKPMSANMYTRNEELKNTFAGTGTGKSAGKTNPLDQEVPEFNSEKKREFAANTYARSTIQKHSGPTNLNKKPSGFNSYFDSVPKTFLKTFREHESFSRRALDIGRRMQRRYDLDPEPGIIHNAFLNCKMQKNKGLIEQIYLE